MGGCMGTHRPGLDQSRNRQALGAGFSGHHHPRHGSGAGHADRSISASIHCLRSSAARWAACRCCNGRRRIRSGCSAAMPIACATRHSAQNIAFHEVGRQAVMADPDWRDGRYFEQGVASAPRARASRGWARTSLICPTRPCTASSAASCRTAQMPTFSFDADFEVESLSAPPGHRPSSSGSTPIRYLYLTRAMDYFDHRGGSWRRAGRRRSRDEHALLCDLVHQ